MQAKAEIELALEFRVHNAAIFGGKGSVGYIKTSVCIDDDVQTLDEYATNVITPTIAAIALQIEVDETNIHHIVTRKVTREGKNENGNKHTS